MQDSYLFLYWETTLFKQNIGRREFYQFRRLAELAVSDDHLLAYYDHLDALKTDMTKRFTDLLELKIPDWIIDPFCVQVETVSLSLQEELIDLQNDCEEKARFKMMSSEQFWPAFSTNVVNMQHYGR